MKISGGRGDRTGSGRPSTTQWTRPCGVVHQLRCGLALVFGEAWRARLAKAVAEIRIGEGEPDDERDCEGLRPESLPEKLVKTMPTVVELPLPLSTRALWRSNRGRVHLSRRYVAWLQDAGWQLKLQRPGKIQGSPVIRQARFG